MVTFARTGHPDSASPPDGGLRATWWQTHLWVHTGASAARECYTEQACGRARGAVTLCRRTKGRDSSETTRSLPRMARGPAETLQSPHHHWTESGWVTLQSPVPVAGLSCRPGLESKPVKMSVCLARAPWLCDEHHGSRSHYLLQPKPPVPPTGRPTCLGASAEVAWTSAPWRPLDSNTTAGTRGALVGGRGLLGRPAIRPMTD